MYDVYIFRILIGYNYIFKFNFYIGKPILTPCSDLFYSNLISSLELFFQVWNFQLGTLPVFQLRQLLSFTQLFVLLYFLVENIMIRHSLFLICLHIFSYISL